MKILWFSPTPSLGENYLNNSPMNGGFIKSLEKEIQHKVDLSIAFYHSGGLSPFVYGETTYYPIDNSKTLISEIKKRLFNAIEPKSDINKFLEIIKQVRPDLIHIHGTERPFGLVQENSTIPSVISIQGNITVCKQKFFSGISLIDIIKYTKLKNWLTFNSYFNLFIRFKKQSQREKKIFKLSKNIIGRTNWDRRITKTFSPNSNYFHNDEILKDIFYEGNWQNKIGDTLNLFTINGPNIFKGIETLIHCAHLLELSNISFNWKVAGLNINDALVKIACKSVKLKISKNIEFLGRLDDISLKENILKSNIYVAVSHIENSPNSLCEALILGTPCVATFAGGTSNFIEDGVSGILIQDGDPYSMAGAIIELYNNYDLAVLYGSNARKRALLKHDKKIIANDLLRIYEKVLVNSKL